LAAELDADDLTAEIVDGGVQVHGRRGPATVDLRVRIRSDTSADLDAFVDGVIEQLEVHVPFPATLCVNEEKIADQVRDGVQNVFDEVNAEQVKQPFIDALADSTGLPAAVIALAFDQLVSLSIRRLRFPRNGNERSIEASPAVAVPRGALTPAPLIAGAV
jgi:hypothetical protein